MLRNALMVLCAFACSTAAARGVVAPRAEVHAAPRAQAADAYRRDDAVAPVARYRARQDVANAGYLGAAMDGDDGGGDNSNGYSSDNGGDSGASNPYQGDGGASFGTFASSAGSGSVAVGGAVSYSGTVRDSGNAPVGCVYKGVMTDAQIATCKAASVAEMRRTGVR